MSSKPPLQVHDVKPVTFEGHMVSSDGEQLVFILRDKIGNVGHIAVDWRNLGLTVQLIGRAAEAGARARQKLGKSDVFDGSGELTAQIVSTFQVSEIPERHLMILSLQSPTGFRSDFAIPTNTVDQRGRPYPRAIVEELLADLTQERHRPN